MCFTVSVHIETVAHSPAPEYLQKLERAAILLVREIVSLEQYLRRECEHSRTLVQSAAAERAASGSPPLANCQKHTSRIRIGCTTTCFNHWIGVHCVDNERN